MAVTFDQIRSALNSAFRNYVTEGVPASGEHDPVKAEIRSSLLLLTTAVEDGGFSEPPNWAEDLAEIMGRFEEINALSAEGSEAYGRAYLYGVSNEVAATLFTATSFELAFADGYYRERYTPLDSPTDVTGWEATGSAPVITEDGLQTAAADGTNAIIIAPPDDFTIFVEADVPASTGVSQVLASVVGSVIEQRIVLYRNADDIYCLQTYNGVDLVVAPGPTDAAARRVRAAFSSESGQTRACFDGGEILVITDDHPTGLLRAWLGILALGQGGELNGSIRSWFVKYGRSTDIDLQRMTTTVDDLQEQDQNTADQNVIDMVAAAITAHGNDDQPHGLPALALTADMAEGKTGLWTVVATDTFTGADGALTTTETGSKTWVALGGNAIHRISGKAASPDATLRGTSFLTGFADGQLEADLDPGTLEASLYFRWSAIGDHLMVQRVPNGAMNIMKFVGGTITLLAQSVFRPYVAGERWKIRMVGPRIWVFRIVSGVEELIFDVTETQWLTNTGVGIRLDGTGTADNFRFLGREAL